VSDYSQVVVPRRRRGWYLLLNTPRSLRSRARNSCYRVGNKAVKIYLDLPPITLITESWPTLVTLGVRHQCPSWNSTARSISRSSFWRGYGQFTLPSGIPYRPAVPLRRLRLPPRPPSDLIFFTVDSPYGGLLTSSTVAVFLPLTADSGEINAGHGKDIDLWGSAPGSLQNCMQPTI